MAGAENKHSRRRLRSSYITTIISISLVLFMLGLLGGFLLNVNQITNYVKENVGFSIILDKNIKPQEVKQIKDILDTEPFVKQTEFIDPDVAAEEFQEALGEEFVKFIGENPLKPSIDVKLNAAYANPDSLAKIEAELLENTKIKEVFYQADLVDALNKNTKKITLYMLIFVGILLVITIALINNTIRLSIYSKRFLIKTMQLVGARHSFIRKPFVLQGIGNGIVGAFIAIGLIITILYYLQKQLPELIDFKNIELYGALFLIVIALGIIISWISTNLAVRKYLRIETGDLH